MNISLRFTIIIPTKNRRQILGQLLGSIGALNDIDRILPEIIVADNNSDDDTWECCQLDGKTFSNDAPELKDRTGGKVCSY